MSTPDTCWTFFGIQSINATSLHPTRTPTSILYGRVMFPLWTTNYPGWPSAVSMQDLIRQPAGWNHHFRPPPIPFHRIYLFPFTPFFWILRIDFYMYMCAPGMGLMVVVAEGGGWGHTPLMGEWRAWKWRVGWLNACPSLPILLVTGGLSFSRPAHLCLPLYDSLGLPICMFDRQQTGLCMSK